MSADRTGQLGVGPCSCVLIYWSLATYIYRLYVADVIWGHWVWGQCKSSVMKTLLWYPNHLIRAEDFPSPFGYTWDPGKIPAQSHVMCIHAGWNGVLRGECLSTGLIMWFARACARVVCCLLIFGNAPCWGVRIPPCLPPSLARSLPPSLPPFFLSPGHVPTGEGAK